MITRGHMDSERTMENEKTKEGGCEGYKRRMEK
jgi:hypothetical protein